MTMMILRSGGYFLLSLIVLATLFSIASSSSNNNNSSDNNNDENNSNNNNSEDVLSLELMDWLKKNGGTINSKLELKLFQPDGVPYQIRGFFTKEDLLQDELIIETPWSLIVKPDLTEKHLRNDECSTMANIYLDMKNDRTPYGTYLKHQPRNYVPRFWSNSGQKLLSKMLGKELVEEWKKSNKPNDYWKKNCKGIEPYGVDMEDELLLHAAMMVRARADDLLMIPVYDMVNHRNGYWYNAAHKIHKNQSYQLIAKRHIKAGEQIYLSYNQCNICHGRIDWHSTPDMFIEYGFVENFPQRYFFEEQRMKFDIIDVVTENEEKTETDENENNETKTSKLVVDFKTPPSQDGIDFIEEQYERLQDFETKYKHKKEVDYNDVPNNEWDKIWELHSAYIKAFTMALDASKNIVLTNEVWDMDEYWYEEDDDDDEKEVEEDGEDDEEDEVEQEF